MRSLLLIGAITFLIADAFASRAISSDWLDAPQPRFPSSALQRGVEGVVRLRVVLSNNGRVTNATVVKSSGEAVLDAAARDTVLKWRMDPRRVKTSDLKAGRVEEIEFKQEAMRSATYPLGVAAGFNTEEQWRRWTYAPFPYYPMDARRLRHEGTVLLIATIGKDGGVVAVQIYKTSGYADLDEEASKALHHWKAHKDYAGQKLGVPVRFTLGLH